MEKCGEAIAFDAMLRFLDEYWRRGNKSSEGLAVLLGSIAKNDDGFPMDIALWQDWKKAYKLAKLAFDSNSGKNPEVTK